MAPEERESSTSPLALRAAACAPGTVRTRSNQSRRRVVRALSGREARPVTGLGSALQPLSGADRATRAEGDRFGGTVTLVHHLPALGTTDPVSVDEGGGAHRSTGASPPVGPRPPC